MVTSLVARLPEPPPPGSAATPEKEEELDPTERALLHVMGRLDSIVLLLGGKPAAPTEAADEAPKETGKKPPPHLETLTAAADLSQQFRAERGHFIRFAWIGAVLAVLALPLTLTLGILIQQQFASLPVPDPTIGWKDRVWDRVGQDIARCMTREAAGAGDCVITIVAPGN